MLVPTTNFIETAEMAGAELEKMMSSSEHCAEFLDSKELNLRLAAIRLCITEWGIGKSRRVLDACRRLAGPEVPDEWRFEPVGFLGIVLEGSRDPEFSRFVASIVVDLRTSDILRIP
jgi:hypothetical protein